MVDALDVNDNIIGMNRAVTSTERHGEAAKSAAQEDEGLPDPQRGAGGQEHATDGDAEDVAASAGRRPAEAQHHGTQRQSAGSALPLFPRQGNYPSQNLFKESPEMPQTVPQSLRQRVPQRVPKRDLQRWP